MPSCVHYQNNKFNYWWKIAVTNHTVFSSRLNVWLLHTHTAVLRDCVKMIRRGSCCVKSVISFLFLLKGVSFFFSFLLRFIIKKEVKTVTWQRCMASLCAVIFLHAHFQLTHLQPKHQLSLFLSLCMWNQTPSCIKHKLTSSTSLSLSPQSGWNHFKF